MSDNNTAFDRGKPGATHYSYISTNGTTYYLHGQVVPNKRRRQVNYYFAKSPTMATACPHLPAGREVVESKNGVPFLRARRV